jgi:hypothetical protein
MAAKDADLATAHADRSLYLSEVDNGADLELTLMEHTIEAELPFLYATDPINGSAFEITGVAGQVDAPAAGGGVTYRMRGYETALMKHVYWNSSVVDPTGADYPGDSGNLTDVGVQRVIGG